MGRQRKVAVLGFAILLQVAVIQTQLHLKRKRLLERRGRGARRWWVRPLNHARERQIHGHYHNLFRRLKETDHEEFFTFTRMLPETFDRLLNLITPFLRKTSIRRPLDTELRLALTLTYLAHGDSVESTRMNFRIGRSTAYKLIPEVCSALWNALQPIVLPYMNQEKWIETAKGFQERWQFPNCVGAVDGKHVKIKAPYRSGTNYFCYKKFFSLVLMAACDADYRFVWVDIGQYGSLSDCSIWTNSDFGKMLEREEVDLPPPKHLPQSNILSDHVFVGDEAFPLKTYMMRPYSVKRLGDAERIFNYRLSRARRVIENSFGILVSRWQILTKTICASPRNATLIVNALVCLHNFLMTDQLHGQYALGRLYCPPDLVDREDENYQLVEGEWRRGAASGILCDLSRVGANNHTRTAERLRDTLRDYFLSPVGEGQAPWQYKRAFRGAIVNGPYEGPDEIDDEFEIAQ